MTGRTHLCRLEARPLAGAHDWIGFYEKFWSGRLDALGARARGRQMQPFWPNWTRLRAGYDDRFPA